ncbi:potassium-transporting ATPase subunit KdpA [Acetobacterium sp. KB-1]|jgi:K+-transporting ATPase ATPase A chain|uniref:potassium-transporting ATPase subunit KdpA n=1 Tax=Acetobacterium sp. KB-1 TaxID=2184575 RepID=UPI000DBEC90F|nr:potassium-transporting ATPase subunit KdpA [Acetobacterium sp. KB-1]AWW27635.1 potassium-transporting ATPase subunit KdpA [Acetobacterium sp. KB-1]
MSEMLITNSLYLVVLVALSIPLGNYIAKVMTGQQVFLSRLILPAEQMVYRLMGIREEDEMSPRHYAVAVMVFSGLGLGSLFALQMLQGNLPFNPQNFAAPSWHLAFNTAASFVSNTNWQAYSGESSLSYLTQALGLGVWNFLSAATGIAVLFALIRGFSRTKKRTIGNFWTDLIRVNFYVLIPLSLVLALVLVSQGVVQTISPYHEIVALETGMTQTVPLGPAASQIAIKQLGTNGGGFFGTNSAFPLENPTALTNFLELLSILLIPASLCVAFGKAVGDIKQGRTIYLVMLILFICSLAAVTISETVGAPILQGVISTGNLEGKEIIHGIGTSALWGTATTAASNGSVNAMHDSFTPLSGLVLMFLMQLGEVVFGGVGSGLYGMIGFVILTVFIAGLMVGRTPEYLGKKVEPFDMKMVCLIVLVPPVFTLLGTALAVLMPQASDWLTNSGPHGFSEILYAFTSMGNNNGSAFGGFAADTVFTNVVGGLIMLIVRLVPLVAVVFLAGNLSNKKLVAKTEGTLSTSNTLFVGLLIAIVLLIGALSFLPALALGPIADYFTAVI